MRCLSRAEHDANAPAPVIGRTTNTYLRPGFTAILIE
jgi:hypothetical protein